MDMEYSNYYVKAIVDISPFEYSRTWGVYSKKPEDPEKIHCQDDDPNLLIWTYDELVAHKIAELLDLDDFMHETENN